MSYILDALKKSDQERTKGKVPDLNTIQDLPGSKNKPSRPPWLLILVAALALNGLLFGIWLYSDRADTPVSELSVTTSTDENKMPTEPVAIADVPAVESASPSEITPTAVKDSITEQIATDVPSENQEGEAEQDMELIAGEPSMENLADDTSEEQSSPPADSDEADTQNVAKAASGPKNPMAYENLPPSLLTELPTFKISVHYYADSPSARMASVNGRMMREGQEVSKGLVLHEITRDGVVFSFQDKFFSYAVFSR